MGLKRINPRRAAIRLLALVLCAAAVCLLRPADSLAAAGGAERAVSMDVSYGFGDTAKSDRYLRVTVVLDNPSDTAFAGELEFFTTQSSLETYRYVWPVSVPGGQRLEEEYYVPLGVKADQMFVTLRDEQGDEAARKRLKLGFSGGAAQSFVGVFSDHPQAMEYLDDVGLSYGLLRTSLVYLDETTAPDRRLGYDQLDLIIVSDYDLNRLSAKQLEAIGSWVDDGGTLLFGGGGRYRETMGPFAQEILEPPYTDPVTGPVDLVVGSEPASGTASRIELECVDLNLKNGSSLVRGDGFALLTSVSRGEGKMVAAAFELGDLGMYCASNAAFLEQLYTAVLGERQVQELSQEEYYGYSGEYFGLQSLINTGNTDRLPNVFLYTVVIAVYLALIGPIIYLTLRKRGIHRYYLAAVAACALLFTGIMYVMGLKTRFRGPFFTYATIADVSRGQVREETYLNIRSPYNNPYSVSLTPEYEVRPLTRSYYYDLTASSRFTGNEDYKTSLSFLPDRTEIRVRDTVAFSPKMFILRRQGKAGEAQGLEASVTFFDGGISGTAKNGTENLLEDAVLLLHGKAVVLGDLEPGQEIALAGCEVINYPLNYSYALAQAVTGADQYDQADISDAAYLEAQEKSRLLSFYMDSGAGVQPGGARLAAFDTNRDQQHFLAGESGTASGLTLVTSQAEVTREQDGLVYRSALERTPTVLSGNCDPNYNTMYVTEPAEPVQLEYLLGSDLEIESLRFERLSDRFSGNPRYPYLSAFSGAVYFYNYDTGRNDPADLEHVYSREELLPYLSPSNTLTVQYVGEGNQEFGWENQLPVIYVTGREK